MASLNPISGVLGRERAAHLLRRSTFGPTLEEIELFSSLTVDQALDLLLDDSAEDPLPPQDPATGSTWVDPQGTSHAGPEAEQEVLFSYFKSWHMDVMRQSPLTLKERLTWFLHTHLPARWTEILSSESIYYQNCLFRHYAYGSFRTLFRKICTDNAMLRYLDGYSNRKGSPNENFAREMFELYSIGKGPQIAEGDYTNYTEQDVKAATDVLTGWMIDEDYSNLDPDCGLPIGKLRSVLVGSGQDAVEVATQHRSGPKEFSAHFDNMIIEATEEAGGYPTVEAAGAELDQMIDMIFARKETGRFIARKLYRFFVYHFISEEAETDIIENLAQNLLDNDYSLIEVLRVLLASQHFYDEDDSLREDDIRGALIKSPVDLFCGLFRFFGMSFPDRESESASFYPEMDIVVNKLVEQGLNFYEPFEVAGYPAYHQIPGFNRNWITTYALAHRYQTGDLLMETTEGEGSRFLFLDILGWVENSGSVPDPADAEALMDIILEGLFAVTMTPERRDYFTYTVFLDNPDNPAYARGQWTMEWNNYKSSGNDAVVRSLLERLLSALIQTPEFQLC